PFRHIVWRREIGRRRKAICAEDGRDVVGDTDDIARSEASLIYVLPIGAAATRVVEVGVRIDERLAHRRASSSRRSTNAALAPASMACSASSSCATAAKL